VRAAELFGITEGTTRVALSRMVTAGELVTWDGRYRLTGRLVDRQTRQAESRAGSTRRWRGGWELCVVLTGQRPAGERAELRDAMAQLRLAELREGTWLRPDNLDPERAPGARTVVEAQCQRFDTKPPGDSVRLAAGLWDLGAWADVAQELRAEMAATSAALEAADPTALAPGFVLSAAVLRHFQHDPLLPDPLLPRAWPGADLRREYERYDEAYRAVLRGWLGAG
ncbi:MAG: PaaX family transcriptional regulator C-terminal domain-containing protein, partial [Acidimicrobiales bacterium]